MNKSFHKWITLSFVVYIGSFFAMQLLAKDREFSELENRVLATRPEWTKESFLGGAYGEDFEEYIADQFPGRDEFIAMKSQMELWLQKTDNNGVYIGKDDYFLQKFDAPDEALMHKNQDYINAFAEEVNLYFMLAPTATKVHEDKLPPFATPYDEKTYIDDFNSGLSDKVHVIPTFDALDAHDEEYIYYKTDHHWTTLGAYYAYEAFCETYGITPLVLEEFERVEGSNAFYGSLFSKGNFTFASPDTLELFYPLEPNEISAYYMLDDKTVDSLYELSHLEKKDKYSVFLDNNHPVIQIKTSVENGKKIAIVKDSYANAVIPFLAQHFEEIHVLDLRFLNMPIKAYMEGEGITDALMLYNVQNFAKETKFSVLD